MSAPRASRRRRQQRRRWVGRPRPIPKHPYAEAFERYVEVLRKVLPQARFEMVWTPPRRGRRRRAR